MTQRSADSLSQRCYSAGGWATFRLPHASRRLLCVCVCVRCWTSPCSPQPPINHPETVVERPCGVVGDRRCVPVGSPLRHLARPRHAATAFTSSSQRSRGQLTRRGSRMAGWRALLTSGLLMCGLVYVIWDELLRGAACRLLASEV